MNKVRISMSLMNNVSEQLEEQNYIINKDSAEYFDKIQFSINMLELHGYITNSIKKGCWAKLRDEVQNEVDNEYQIQTE